VEAAKKMLETQSTTFEEISYRSGYENPGPFREIFKKTYGAFARPLRTLLQRRALKAKVQTVCCTPANRFGGRNMLI